MNLSMSRRIQKLNRYFEFFQTQFEIEKSSCDMRAWLSCVNVAAAMTSSLSAVIAAVSGRSCRFGDESVITPPSPKLRSNWPCFDGLETKMRRASEERLEEIEPTR